MMMNEIVYFAGPGTSLRASTIALTISGPSTPAADHAVSSRPWMAPTW